VLPVQVIGQQWEFTYRYPTYGGVETAELMLPVNTEIEFHVTSLDAIHSFWAYQLGVKADANPGVDNIAFVKPTKLGSFQVRCAELCGIWHGYMFDTGHVVQSSRFTSWIKQQQQAFSAVQRYLPKYSTTYSPDPVARAG
jgi:cytochrome c oxidase subunit II